MQNEVMFSGFGGQGILLSAKILAHAAFENGYEVMWVPSYGPEMRGGTTNCMVIISNKLIGSPIIKNPMNLVAMNRPSLDKFAPMVKTNGMILINNTLITVTSNRDDINELSIPINDIALKIGTVKSANIIALSAFVAHSKFVKMEILKKCVKKAFSNKPKLISVNMKAIEEGEKTIASL